MSIKNLLKKHKEALRTGKKTITFTIEEVDMLVNEITELLTDNVKKKAEAQNKKEEILKIEIDSGKW